MKLSSGLRNVLALVVVMAVAIFFRFYRLDSVPPGLYPDIAINGNNALQSIQSDDYKTFYTDNNGREGMIMWLDAISIKIFGITALALKIPTAIFGTLTVLGIYLLARELFNPPLLPQGEATSGKVKRRNAIALLSAFLLATSFWHINFSRIGFRVALMPFFLVFTFYFLAKAFRTRKFLWAIPAGLFFGLGFYTYTGYRLAVPLLLCVLALWLIPFWKNKQQLFKISLAVLITTFFVALPIGIYFLHNPGDFLGRAGQTSVFAAKQPLLELGKSLILHLGMFNFYGDGNWRHNLSGEPELFWPVGVLFLIGFGIALGKLARRSKTPADPQESCSCEAERIAYATLLLWFFFMLLPGILTSEGIPHSLRTLGVIPAVMILAAVGGIFVYDRLKPRLPKIIFIIIAVIFIASCAIQGYWQYFIAWAGNIEVQGAFTTYFVDIGQLSSRLHDQGRRTIVIVNENGTPVPYPDGIPMPAQTVKFIEAGDCYKLGDSIDKCGPYSTYLAPDQLDRIAINSNTAVILMKNDQALFNQLSKMFPQGQIKQINNIRYYEINQ